MHCKPTVVRGNAGEVMALAGSVGNTKGVDSTAAVTDAHSAAIQLAREHGCIVAVSGAVDFVRSPISTQLQSSELLLDAGTMFCMLPSGGQLG